MSIQMDQVGLDGNKWAQWA